MGSGRDGEGSRVGRVAHSQEERWPGLALAVLRARRRQKVGARSPCSHVPSSFTPSCKRTHTDEAAAEGYFSA
jgi:hypothetical protein